MRPEPAGAAVRSPSSVIAPHAPATETLREISCSTQELSSSPFDGSLNPR
jgi:hypothetical protein